MSLVQDLFGGSIMSDEDTSLKGSSGNYGKFGLNKAKLVKVEFNPNAGKDGAPTNALDIEVNIGEKRFLQRQFEVSKIFGKDGTEITDKDSEEYIKGFTAAVKQQQGLLTHYLKIFYTEEKIKQVFSSVTIKTFEDYFKFVAEAIAMGIKEKGNDVDVFLQYQWNITSGQDKTYLELPKNMKDGYFICKATTPKGGEWKEVRDTKGLHYEDAEGNIHKFVKDNNFLASKKGIQQTSGEAPNSMGATSTTSSSSSW